MTSPATNPGSTRLTIAPAASVATSNACRLCAPLGASLVFRGVEGCVPFLHGSQGCATYMRRYIISHFREPMDIACSNFAEQTAIFGGGRNFSLGLANVIRQYRPQMIGIATTCLAETIGEDVRLLLSQFREPFEAEGVELPALVHVSTPSYRGSHADGYFDTLNAIMSTLPEGDGAGLTNGTVNLLAGMVSPEDLRHLRELVELFGLDVTLLPDYSETLDGPAWADYERLPRGGTPVARVRGMGRANATLQVGCLAAHASPARTLERRCAVASTALPLPIGIRSTDALCTELARLAGCQVPAKLAGERGRLVDSLVDGHKYVFGRRVVLYGEEDLVIALAAFATEIGLEPVLCATGGASGRFEQLLHEHVPALPSSTAVLDDADFVDIESVAEQLAPDLLIGHSKGYKLSRKLGVPLVRVGFPIHDRIGAARVLTVGYRGTQQLFDRVVNALLETRQNDSDIGWGYL